MAESLDGLREQFREAAIAYSRAYHEAREAEHEARRTGNQDTPWDAPTAVREEKEARAAGEVYLVRSVDALYAQVKALQSSVEGHPDRIVQIAIRMTHAEGIRFDRNAEELCGNVQGKMSRRGAYILALMDEKEEHNG